MTTRTLTTKKGRTIETSLSDEQAKGILIEERDAGRLGSFGLDLLSKGRRWGLSADQWVWVQILANEALSKRAAPAEPEVVGGFGPALAYLTAAVDAGLSWPKVRMQTDEGRKVVLSLTGKNSKRPGTVNLTDGGKFGENVWYGRINEAGELEASRQMTDDVFATLQDFCDDPAGTASAQGRLTGRCCFCGRDLDTKESVGAGYGPVCAEKWGLPWGEVTAEQYEAEKAAAIVAAEDAARNGWVQEPSLEDLIAGATLGTAEIAGS